MKTVEEILKLNFGGLIGQSNVYITDKNLLIEAIKSYAKEACKEQRNLAQQHCMKLHKHVLLELPEPELL